MEKAICTEPLVIRRNDDEFALRRVSDREWWRLGRHATAIEDDPLFWLMRGALGRRRLLSLPEYFVALSHLFGASSDHFDDYKSSFCFPFHLTTAKGAARGDYILLVRDRKGGPDSALWRCDGSSRSGLRPIEPFVAAEFSRDDYRHVMNHLEGYVMGYLNTARLAVPDFVNVVESVLLRYGYRNGQPFEHRCEDDEEFDAAAQRYEAMPVGADVVPGE